MSLVNQAEILGLESLVESKGCRSEFDASTADKKEFATS